MARRLVSKRAEKFTEQVDGWNANYPVGTPVTVTRDDGDKLETATRSIAWTLYGGTAVIMVDGIAGAYLLERTAPRL